MKELQGPYTVGVGRSWSQSTGSPVPDYTCGHRHKTARAAFACGKRLYGARYVRGQWQACAKWHDYYIIDGTGAKVCEEERPTYRQAGEDRS